MHVTVCGAAAAECYSPTSPTWGVRIFYPEGTDRALRAYETPLARSANWTGISTYRFDERGNGLDRDITLQMLADFDQYGSPAKEVLVHCMLGGKRSQAVARFFAKARPQFFDDAERAAIVNLMDYSRDCCVA
ncbi:MAG: hypothetical protein AABX70_01790 [Nanoarchaeota archaeon]